MVEKISSKTTTGKINLLVILALAMIGFLSVLFATRWGIGTSPDSATYLEGGRNILLGNGFSLLSLDGTYDPITHYPPFYPGLLALLGVFGIDPMHGAQYINSVLFGLNILVVGLILKRTFKVDIARSMVISVVGAFLVLTSTTMLEIHVMAWTEATYILLSLLGLYLLGTYLENPKRLILLVSAVPIGMAFITRFVGASLIVTGVIGIFLFASMPGRRKLVDITLFGLIAVLPMLIWLTGNYIAAGNGTNRELLYHPLQIGHARAALTTLASWFLIPVSASGYLKILPLALLALGLFGVIYADKGGHAFGMDRISLFKDFPGIVKLILILIPLYFALLVLSISFFDANTPLDNRVLSPIYVAGLILTLYIIGELWRRQNKVPILISIFCGALTVVFLASYLLNGVSLINRDYQIGIGYNKVAWHNSEALNYVSELPTDAVIFSNAPEAVYIQTGRQAFGLPKKFENMTQRENPNFMEDLDRMEEFVEQEGVIVYFNSISRPTEPNEKELIELLDMYVVKQASDGTIYEVDGSK